MFKFKRVDEVPLPLWLTAQAAAVAPADSERARLLRQESKDEKLICHSRARTAAIIATLLCVMGLLGALLYLTYEATGVFRSARDSVGTKVTTLMNLTGTMALDTRMAINSLRGASRNAELFSVHSFEHEKTILVTSCRLWLGSEPVLTSRCTRRRCDWATSKASAESARFRQLCGGKLPFSSGSFGLL